MSLLYGFFKALICVKGDDVGGNETNVRMCLLYGFFNSLLCVKGDEIAKKKKKM